MQISTLLSIVLPIASAFPLNGLSPSSIVRRNLSDSTQNDVVDGVPCKEVTVLFARGTVSPGNVGTDVGPPFFEAIAALIGTDNVAVQGLDYPASILGFLEGGDDAGATLLVQLTAQAMNQCPDSKVVLSGYSQGGQEVHKAANQLNATVATKLSSVVIFGDPLNGTAVGTLDQSKVLIICHSGDDICKQEIIVTSDHLDYSENAGEAAAFVVRKAGL